VKDGSRGKPKASKRARRERFSSDASLLSPIRLTESEAEAIGVGLVLASRDDPVRAETARTALAKIVAAGPAAFRARLAHASANVAQPRPIADWDELIGIVESAIGDERELRILYYDQAGQDSVRTIKPLAVAESRQGDSIAAWCNLRRDFRHFRLDRIAGITALESFFKGERDALLDLYMRADSE
jgi:predicted DNA-binding transcriptional regulator YafY